MREIKFRVWDKKEKRMISTSGSSEGDFWYPWGFQMRSKYNDKDSSSLDCEIMQFTGRKDRNNKEIYGGDILFNKGILVGVVKFGEYKCRNQSKHDRQLPHIGWFVETKTGECLSLEYLFWNLQDNLSIKKREDQNWVEVKGDIYRNPELLMEGE